jgi:hypothetical protein
MRSHTRTQAAGYAAIAGGVLGMVLAPIMVMVKYLTGWAVIPEPSWIEVVRPALGLMLTFATPVQLWVVYGSIYTMALLLMFVGLLALAAQSRRLRGRVEPRGLWILIAGLCLVIVGDCVHTLTWHQNGLTVPTPGTNPIANTAYAVHMMGMNIVLVGSAMTGISALRRRLLPSWLAWLFILIAPGAVAMSLTLLPTTPSGALWLFSLTMIILGYHLRSNRSPVLTTV